jgi:uncharacterized protein with HEPN domain
MKLEVKKVLYDLGESIELIASFTQAKQLRDYKTDVLLRSAVERQFEIVGEALNRLKKIDQSVVEKITDYQRIIGFRNVLAHAYDMISDEIVWDIVQNKLPQLRQDITDLKREFGIK